MNKEQLLLDLKHRKEMIPDLHDGSYELVRSIIESYSKLENYNSVTYLDMDAVYLLAIGTWKINVEKKKEKVNNTCLPDVEKTRMVQVIDKIWDNACHQKYENKVDSKKPTVGMFGTGFMSFKGTTTDQCARDFIELCVEIIQIPDENSELIYNKCQKVINYTFKGMKAASASVVLHCLKPNVFPIINGNQGMGSIFSLLGIELKKPTEIGTYIDNCRRINNFRNAELPFKNYRILDLVARDIFGEEVIDVNRGDGEVVKKSFDYNVILYGPPGTGKTYNTAIYAVAICDGKSLEELTDYDAVMERYNELKSQHRVAFTTFHQSYGYEEFIEGIKPVVDSDSSDVSYTIEEGVFKKFCENAKSVQESQKVVEGDTKNEQPYVFIIDEINRGNISKIFGELITLIENTKREGMPEAASAILPYSGEAFSVPSNVYILGTMNTADRSIALMDTALRRRFQFVEMMPDADVLRVIGADKVKVGDVELDVAAMLETINERISFLYDREHTIGHAFFTGLKDDPSVEKLASIFAKSVIPLLQEYFYEDYQKIQLVLGDNGKSDESHKFIKDIKVVAKNIFKGSVDDVIDLPEKKYEVNDNALMNIRSYIEIM